jgi:hypothetical protein
MMETAWRGVVDNDGHIWAWPTLLMTHDQAFAAEVGWAIEDYRARWRQWEPGGPVDFDPGASNEDRAAVVSWVTAASAPYLLDPIALAAMS